MTREKAALVALGLAAVAFALTGCETTAEKSARLEKAAKRVTLAQQHGLSIARESTVVGVVDSSAVPGSEGTAAVLTLRNSSAKALSKVPIAISLKDAHGTSVYTNSTPGLAATLTSVAAIPAHGEVTWIDDQIPAKGARRVDAKIGEGSAVAATLPKLELQDVHLAEDPGGGTDAEGTVVNSSTIGQSELVVYGLARRSGRIVAAGRAVLESLAAGASAPFQIFFVGDPQGAALQLSAPATTLG